MTNSCIACCNFGTMFFNKNVSIDPFENTAIQGVNICLAETSLGCHRTNAFANFALIVGYTNSNFDPANKI